MKVSIPAIYAFLILSLTANFHLFAEKTHLSRFENSFAFEYISQSLQSEDGQWIFVTASEKGKNYDNLYALNIADPQKSALILENKSRRSEFFSNLCYLKENQTLYFAVHTGKYFENGSQTFESEGLYVLKKDSQGLYTAKNLRRFQKMEPWLLEKAKSAWLDNPSQPDYSRFLQVLFSYCDFDANPVFVYETETDTGAKKELFNEDALRYLHEKNLLATLVSRIKGNYNSQIGDFLFCLDENHNPTQKPAVTANHCHLFYSDGMAFSNYLYLTAYKGRIYLLEAQGSFKGEKWSFDNARLHRIFDDDGDFSVMQEPSDKEIKAAMFEIPYPKGENKPFSVWKGNLYLKGADSGEFYRLGDDEKFSKINVDDILGEDSAGAFMPVAISVLIFIFITAILISVLLLKKKPSPKAIFACEEKLRQTISANIHDSIVQDIRALRLDVEKLKVQEESVSLKKEIVANLTQSIKKMRDICYGLNPAEIAVAAITEAKVDFISVTQTLCENFSSKTKIPFNMSLEGDEGKILLDEEKSRCLARIVTEILSNVEKHSYATKLHVLVKIENEVESGGEEKSATIYFIDNGVGCDMDWISSKKSMKNHFGIRNMRQYAKLCDSKIDFLSAPNDGMQVKLSVKV
ncbi:MAG: hypothetical protein IJ727_10590 [Treponema sp.]|nr:hypothetical protein [Treponema sp.]